MGQLHYSVKLSNFFLVILFKSWCAIKKLISTGKAAAVRLTWFPWCFATWPRSIRCEIFPIAQQPVTAFNWANRLFLVIVACSTSTSTAVGRFSKTTNLRFCIIFKKRDAGTQRHAKHQREDVFLMDASVMILFWSTLICFALLKYRKVKAAFKWHFSNLVTFIRLATWKLDIWLS